MYYNLNPEVAGHFGIMTIANLSLRPPVVQKFHYEFDGWLGDDLLETIGCYIISQKLKEFLYNQNFTGYEIDKVLVTTSEQFEELHPNCDLPLFWWLKVTGHATLDDFGYGVGHGLVISDRALTAIKENCQLDYCEIKEYDAG